MISAAYNALRFFLEWFQRIGLHDKTHNTLPFHGLNRQHTFFCTLQGCHLSLGRGLATFVIQVWLPGSAPQGKFHILHNLKTKTVMKKTKIVCTIGPKTESEEMLTKMLEAGMNVMRLNFSR